MILIVGSSGSGKSTLQELLVSHGYERGISWMTRPPRDGEVDGVDAHFITQEEFKKKIDEGFFAEHEFVHNNYYGTAISDLSRNVVKIVEPKGMASLQLLDPSIITIYVNVSFKERVRRMKLRMDNKDVLAQRMITDYHLFTKDIISKCNINFNNEDILTTTKVNKLMMIIELMTAQRLIEVR